MNNFPTLRFKGFDDDYVKSKLESIVDFRSGGTPSMDKPEYWNGNIPWISAASMRGKYYTQSDRTITSLGLSNGSKLAKKGSLLLLTRGSMLFNKIPIGIAGIDVAFNQDLKNLVVGNISTTEFIYQWFQAKEPQLMNMVVGTGIGAGKLETSDIKDLSISIPTLPEQQKIASFLSAVDEKIQQLTRKKELLEQYKKGVMQQLFSSSELGLDRLKDDRINPSIQESYKSKFRQLRFKDENGKDYPKWEEKRLDEIAEFRRGSFPQPYGLPKWYDPENGFPFVQVYDVDDNMLLKPSTKVKISKLAAEQSVFVKKGSLVITIQGSIGRIAKTQYDTYVDRTLLIFQSFNEPIDIDYFKYVLYLLFEIEKTKAPGGTIKTITKEALSSFKILLPQIEEQQKIASFLTALDTKIESVASQIAHTQTFKKGLLQQMFV